MTSLTLDEHQDESRRAQREADRWLIVGTILMGTLVLGPVGLPVFCRGVFLMRRAQQAGLSVRPMMVTLIGYVVILDAAISAELEAASAGEEVWRVVGRYVDAILSVGVSTRMNRTLRRMRVLVEVSDVNAVSPAAVETTRLGILETISFIRARNGKRAARKQIETQRAAAKHLMAALDERQST
jgi:hypothetical protein